MGSGGWRGLCKECDRARVLIRAPIVNAVASLCNKWAGGAHKYAMLSRPERMELRRRAYVIVENVASTLAPVLALPSPFQDMLDANAGITNSTPKPRVKQVPKWQFHYGSYDRIDHPDSEVKYGSTSEPYKRPTSGRDAFAKRNVPDPVFFCVVPLGLMTYSERLLIEGHVRTLLPPTIDFGPGAGIEHHKMSREFASYVIEHFRNCGPIHTWNHDLLTWTP